jgi:cyclase
MLEALTQGKASAALIASIVHYGDHSIGELKRLLAEHGCKVRPPV